jgi:hypothetical protein
MYYSSLVPKPCVYGSNVGNGLGKMNSTLAGGSGDGVGHIITGGIF